MAPRDSVAAMTENIADTGAAALREAKASLDETIEMVGEKSGEALEALREVSEVLTDRVEGALQRRPIVTLAVALGVGFLIGAAWRR
jgi:ElaB/YqjD/DUF883 family membrane-anchored ribosome-binding protein